MADHAHEAEAVLRELEEEIAREAAASSGEEPQVTTNPRPRVEDEAEGVPVADETETGSPDDGTETVESPAAPDTTSQDTDEPPAPPTDWAPPSTETPPAGLGWQSEPEAVPGEWPTEEDEVPGEVQDEELDQVLDQDHDHDQDYDQTPGPAAGDWGARPSAPSGAGPMVMPPAQRGVPPLPPPPPTVPTGWLIDQDDDQHPDDEVAGTPLAYGPPTPAGTPAYLQGAYSSSDTLAPPFRRTSGPPGGLPMVRPLGPPWWRKQSTLIAGAAIVLVVLLGVFAFVVLREDSPSLTYNGEEIAEAEATLASAERTLASIVEERNGASSDDTRCYFSLENADTTDVADHLRCGPVLFVDGDETQPYLTFPLTRDDAEGDGVRLVAADQPETPEPTKLDPGEELRRPDDASPPAGAGGLEVPPPPRADPGIFEANPLEGVELQDPGSEAEIVSYGTRYRMTGFAEPDRYGSGDAARRPARGEKFVAVQFDVGLGEFPMVTDNPTLAVQIGSEPPIPIPGDPEVTLDSMILSVPEDTDVVDLVVTEQGVEQRLSLLDGTPGANNVAVLRRDTLDHITNASADLSFSASRPGYVTESFTVNVGITAARLFWFFGEGGVQHPSGPNRAWLVPETTHAWGPGLNAGPNVSLDPEFFTLTLADGTVINASNLATDGGILVAFDVPADFSQGTITVGGVVTRFNGETWDFGASKLEVPVNIPAG